MNADLIILLLPGFDSLIYYMAGSTQATLWRHIVTFLCGRDVASHRFPLFRCEAVYMSVHGKRPWRAAANPRHSLAWLFVEDSSTRVIVADRRAHGFILRVHAETEVVRCMAVGWPYPFTRATLWHGLVKTQAYITCFSVVPRCHGHKVARVLPAYRCLRDSYPELESF